MASEMGNNTPEFCLKCGAPLSAGTKICPKCGASIINQAYRKSAARAPEEAQGPAVKKEQPSAAKEPEKASVKKPASSGAPRSRREKKAAVKKASGKTARKDTGKKAGASAGEAAGKAAGKVLSVLKTIAGAIAACAAALFGFAGKMWKKSPKFFIGTVAAIFILIVILALSGNKTYRKPLASYIKGLNDQNTELMLSAFPSQITDEGVSYAKTLESAAATAIENQKTAYGSSKVSYEVTNTVKLGEAQIAEIEQRYSNKCKADINITAGYDLKTEYTVNYKENGADKSDTRTLHFIVIKAGGKWYLDPLTSDL